MKKILSIGLLILALICSTFVLTGCTPKDEDLNLKEQLHIPTSNPNIDIKDNKIETNKQESSTNTQLKAQTSLAPLLTNNYYIKLLTDAENDIGELVKNVTVEISVNGNNFATDMSKIDYGMIVKDKTMYSIMHSIKQYVKMDLDPTAKQEILYNFTNENYINTFNKLGTKKLYDKDYYFEEYQFETETNILYFEDNTLKYIEILPIGSKQSTIMEILEISNTYKKELFEIPSDYTSFEI